MSNLSAREELREALHEWEDTGLPDDLRLKAAVKRILSEPSPVYSDDLVLVKRLHLDYAGLAILNSNTNDLVDAVEAMQRFHQPAPISSSHPETISYDEKRYRLVARGSDAEFEGADTDIIRSLEGEVLDPYVGEADESMTIRHCGMFAAGAALYRLITPRVWEIEGTISGIENVLRCKDVPDNVRVKGVFTEILEEEK